LLIIVLLQCQEVQAEISEENDLKNMAKEAMGAIFAPSSVR
jgi:hypothetical protein